jgi:hypothetical protein
MKIVSLCFVFACLCNAVIAQRNVELDKSPLDMVYYPVNYPVQKMNGKEKQPPEARVIYSRPQKNGRTIFDGIVKYNQVWRLGANEATEIEFFTDAKISGKTISKGRYTMYAICNLDKWTMIFNTDNYVWGLAYNQKKDALRVDAPAQKNTEDVEAFTMYFDGTTQKAATLNIMWEKTKVVLPITF